MTVDLVENWEQVFPHVCPLVTMTTKGTGMQFSKKYKHHFSNITETLKFIHKCRFFHSFFCHNVIENRMVITGHTHIKTCWKKEKKNLLSMLTDLSGILYKLMPLSFELATWVDVSVPRFVCGAEYGHSLGVLRHDSLHRVCGASYVNGWVILNLQKTEPHS